MILRFGPDLRWRDQRGATTIEFAIIAPVLLLLIFGLMEIGYMIYASAVLQGAVQSAGRSSGLEVGQTTQAAIDEAVRRRIRSVIPDAEISFRRRNYQNFGDVERPEDFDDLNRNDAYDNNECFDDENGNERWDDDVGRSGQGSANDVVLYSVSVRYDPLLAVGETLGLSGERRLSATTTLRNQPFATQPIREVVHLCP